MKNKELLMNTLKGTAPGLATTALIIAIIILFKPNFPLLLAGFLTYSLATHTWQLYKSRWYSPGWTKKLLTAIATTAIVITGLYHINLYAGAWGWLGFGLTILIISGIILIRRKKQFMFWIRHIETIIWGSTAEERRDKRGR